MGGMIKYEWKKIWKSRLAQLSIIGCGLFLVFCVWSSIMQISATNEKGENFSGMSAVEVMKNTQKKIELTQENVNDIVGRYLKIHFRSWYKFRKRNISLFVRRGI